MFPHTQNRPPFPTKSGAFAAISANVAVDFLVPIVAIGIWTAEMLMTTVPKTTIHEDGDSLIGKYDVGVACDTFGVKIETL